MAEREKEKGNEAFKAADYEDALRHYNASIDVDSNPNAYNNRAITCKQTHSFTSFTSSILILN